MPAFESWDNGSCGLCESKYMVGSCSNSRSMLRVASMSLVSIMFEIMHSLVVGVNPPLLSYSGGLSGKGMVSRIVGSTDTTQDGSCEPGEGNEPSSGPSKSVLDWVSCGLRDGGPSLHTFSHEPSRFIISSSSNQDRILRKTAISLVAGHSGPHPANICMIQAKGLET